MPSAPFALALFACVASPPLPASAFTGSGLPLRFPSVFGRQPANPALADYADAQDGQSLKLRLEIGKEDDESTPNLLIDGMHLELGSDVHPSKVRRVPLPGFDGPNPGLSSGPRILTTLNEGMFVGLDGMETIGLCDGCWELVWREDALAGSIVWGFDHPEESRRNAHSSSLPKGRVYMSFPVWTRESLDKRQADKARILKVAEGHGEEFRSHIRKMNESKNPLMKALHFRNAAAAHEKIDMSGARSVREIPDDDDVVPIGKDLLICRKGTVWTKDGSFLGGGHALLGHATVKPRELAP